MTPKALEQAIEYLNKHMDMEETPYIYQKELAKVMVGFAMKEVAGRQSLTDAIDELLIANLKLAHEIILQLKGQLLDAEKKIGKLESREQEEIKEGDYCLCLFGNSGHKFWPNLLQLLKVKTVTVDKNEPNLLTFENTYPDKSFYANDFIRVDAYLAELINRIILSQPIERESKP